MSEKLILIDGHSILNRAFFGLPDLTNSEGRHTGAVYGFLNILFRILDEEKPKYLTVAFDLHEPTFRHKMYDAYKGTRKPMPEELREQVPLIKEVLTAMKVAIVTMEGYEADDILGTLSVKAEKEGNREKNKKRTRKSFTKGREDGNINGHSTRETSERTLKTEQERIKHNVNESLEINRKQKKS